MEIVQVDAAAQGRREGRVALGNREFGSYHDALRGAAAGDRDGGRGRGLRRRARPAVRRRRGAGDRGREVLHVGNRPRRSAGADRAVRRRAHRRRAHAPARAHRHRFDGREAERIGLVDVACADTAALEAALAQVLAEIGRCAPGANAVIKRLLLASRTMPREQLLDESADAFAACLRGPEGQEGVTAFLRRSASRTSLGHRTKRERMSLAGQAVVAIWNGIAPEGRTEFYEWHNREHMPERVGIPGFRRGRRYIAKYGTPEYLHALRGRQRRSAGRAGLSQPAEQSDAVDAARAADLLPRHRRAASAG